jgi:Protein of unknown function (DUF3352)
MVRMRALVRRRRISTVLLACLAVPAAMIAGCGGGDDDGGDVDVGPAAVAPSSAPIYLDATVKPTGSAQSDARAALSKVFGTNDPGGKIVSLIDQEGRKQAANERFTYAADIEPWLGERIGFFFTSFAGEGTGAAVVETTDPDQALAFARRSESGATQTSGQGGTTVYTNPADGDSFASVGDFLVFGDREAVNAAIDANGGESLADSSDFTDALADLPDDRLGTFYTVPKTLIDAIPSEEIDPTSRSFFESAAGDNLNDPVSGALTASADSFDLEFVGGSTGTETPESTLVGEVPSQSWLAVGTADLGEIVKQSLERSKEQIPNYEEAIRQIESTSGASLDELTGALGDAVLYVEGITESTLTGALVVEAKDPELIGRLLGQLQGLLRLGGGGVRPLELGGGTGFQINDPSMAPAPIEIAEQGGKLVIGYGANSAARTLTPADTLADKALFSSAKDKVADLGTDFFLDFSAVFKLAESTGAKADPGYLQAKPYIRALSYLVSGSGSSGDQTEVKAVLGLK